MSDPIPDLIFHACPAVTFATNTFVNVPVILQHDDQPLIEVIQGENVGYTTQFRIHHSDGTYLAKVVGSRLFDTEVDPKNWTTR